MKNIQCCPNCNHSKYITQMNVNYYECSCCSWSGQYHELIQRIRVEPDFLIELLRGLDKDERNQVFSKFCRHCGDIDPECYCQVY